MRSWLGIAFALLACSSPVTPPKRPLPSEPLELAAFRAARESLVGIVTLDGKPVPSFGVTVTSSPEYPFDAVTLAIRDEEGRFAIHAPRGRWDLIVAGPGFARRVITNVDVPVKTPLAIAVERGRTIAGTVSDWNSAPVVGAAVTIGDPTGHLLHDLARNEFFATSDRHGRFRIENVPSDVVNPTVHAYVLGWAASPQRTVRGADTAVELRLARVGTITGVVGGRRWQTYPPTPRILHAWPLDGNSLYTTTFDEDGAFSFADLPVGEYRVGAFGDSQPVTVVAGQVTRVALE